MSENSYTRVSEVMTPSPKVIDRLATVQEAIELMRQDRISSLVIDRRHEGDEYGLVVVHDIAAKVIAPDLSPKRVNVYEIMSKPVLTVDCDMDIKYAIRLLARFGISRGLVTEKGTLTGIVTMRDMVLRYSAPKEDNSVPDP
ncbi:MAG: CBS domain-containing protein [Rhodospirillales bacterium]|nr:CBS domain-containing protein [Rhodospirillales bacterium]